MAHAVFLGYDTNGELAFMAQRASGPVDGVVRQTVASYRTPSSNRPQASLNSGSLNIQRSWRSRACGPRARIGCGSILRHRRSLPDRVIPATRRPAPRTCPRRQPIRVHPQNPADIGRASARARSLQALHARRCPASSATETPTLNSFCPPRFLNMSELAGTAIVSPSAEAVAWGTPLPSCCLPLPAPAREPARADRPCVLQLRCVSGGRYFDFRYGTGRQGREGQPD